MLVGDGPLYGILVSLGWDSSLGGTIFLRGAGWNDSGRTDAGAEWVRELALGDSEEESSFQAV